MVAGDVMHVIAYFSLAVLLFMLCTRKMSAGSAWMPPFFFLFGCFILTCGVTHVLNLYTVWVPSYALESRWKVLSGSVSVLTLLVVAFHRRQFKIWLGAGESFLWGWLAQQAKVFWPHIKKVG